MKSLRVPEKLQSPDIPESGSNQIFDQSLFEKILQPEDKKESSEEVPMFFSYSPEILLSGKKDGEIFLDIFFENIYNDILDGDTGHAYIIAHYLNDFLIKLSTVLEKYSLSRDNHKVIFQVLENICGYQPGICGLRFTPEQKNEHGSVHKIVRLLIEKFSPTLSQGQEEACKTLLRDADLILLRFSRLVRWDPGMSREEMSQAAGHTIGEIMRVFPLRGIGADQKQELFQQAIKLAKKVRSETSIEIFHIAKNTLFSDEHLFVPDISRFIEGLRNLTREDVSISNLREYEDCLQFAAGLQKNCLAEYNKNELQKINHYNNSVVFYFDGLTHYLNIQHFLKLRTNTNGDHIDFCVQESKNALQKTMDLLAMSGIKYANGADCQIETAIGTLIQICVSKEESWTHPILSTVLNDIVLFNSQVNNIKRADYKKLFRYCVLTIIDKKPGNSSAISARLLSNLLRIEFSPYAKDPEIRESIHLLIQNQNTLSDHQDVLIQLSDWLAWDYYSHSNEESHIHGKNLSNSLLTLPEQQTESSKIVSERNFGRITTLRNIFANAHLCTSIAYDIQRNPEKPIHTLLNAINQEILCGLFQVEIHPASDLVINDALVYDLHSTIIFNPTYGQTPGSDGIFQQAKKFITHLFEITKNQEKHLENITPLK